MLKFANEKFIPAHHDITKEYYNHSYDRKVRDAFCSECETVIGEQVKYEMDEEFSFVDRKYNDFRYCPNCGELLSSDSDVTKVIKEIERELNIVDGNIYALKSSTTPEVIKFSTSVELWKESNNRLKKLISNLKSIDSFD